MVRHALTTLALVSGLSSAAQADAIDDFVEAERQRQQIPGVAVGIFRNGQPLRLQGYGLANIEHNVPVHPDTIFQSGSIGKMFTAVAAMLLVEDGKLNLDGSIRQYLPDAPASWQPITLRHLLNHTSGLGHAELDYQDEYTDDELLRKFYAAPLEFPAGRRWTYSNTGYATVGIVIGKVAGKPYGQVLAERVFGPLGMRSARVISDRDIVMHRAAGYEMTDAGPRNHRWVSAALNGTADGSLYLSVLDYVRWDAAVAGREVLQPESWQEVLRPAPLDNGGIYPYGFGWNVEQSPDGQLVIGHGGAWQGFRTDLRRYDGDGVGFIVLANSARADVGRILQGVAERHDARYEAPADTPVADEQPPLSRAVRQLLEWLGSGTATEADFPGEDARRATRWLASHRDLLEQVGACQALELVRHQPNGDRLERRYRADCAQGGIIVQVQFDQEGVLQSLWARPLS